MRQPDYDRGETIDDVADEAYERAVQEKLDGPDFNTEANLHADTVAERFAADALVAQPQKCSFCPQIFAGPKCPGCNEERPTLTAMKNISAKEQPVVDLMAELRARMADDTDVAYIARHCGAV